MIDVPVPAGLWPDGSEAAISTWLYQDGDRVETGCILAEIMVEKSNYELVAPASGILHIVIEIEAIVAAGQVAARIA